jgi:hypothetical protein
MVISTTTITSLTFAQFIQHDAGQEKGHVIYSFILL